MSFITSRYKSIALALRDDTSADHLRKVGLWTGVAASAIFVVGFALRLYCLDCHSLWHDEIISIEVAQRGLHAIFNDRFGWLGNQTPWYYMLVWLTILPADPTTTAVFVRLPEALAGALTVPVVYGLGREMFGQAQALMASLMTALSVPLLNHSQDVRSYALVILFTTASIYCLLMLQRSRKAWRWPAFAVLAVANSLIAYFAVTLVMPTLVPYLLWVLWQLWARRRQQTRQLAVALISLLLVALAVTTTLADISHIAKAPPSLGQLSPTYVLATASDILVAFTQFGLANQIQHWATRALLVFALLGIYLSLRYGRHKLGVCLCSVFVVVPSLILIVLSSSNPVFARYIFFSVPFYFLLVSNGVVAIVASAPNFHVAPASITALKVVSGLLALLMLIPFILGVCTYNSPNGHNRVSLRQDFRSTASYLSAHARPQDMIIVVETPLHGLISTNFYWHDNPPAPVFSALDPTLFTQMPKASVYWVISMLDYLNLPREIAPTSAGWVEVARFEDIVILQEDHPKSLRDSFSTVVSRIVAIIPNSHFALTLQGCLYQAQGDIGKTASVYKSAVLFATPWDEELKSAEGFDALNMRAEGWRWGLTAKLDQPGSPQVHRWLSERLAQDGYAAESRTEADLAQALER